MNSQSMDEFFRELYEDSEQSRKHDPYFTLSKDKQQNELEVAHLLNEELKNRGAKYFDSIVARDSGKDPPDCEAIGDDGERIGIEVTELVDEDSITSAISGKMIDQLLPKPSEVIEKVSAMIRRKDCAIVKDGPYDLYILIIYCDDPKFLAFDIHNELRNSRFGPTKLTDHAYFFQYYNPWKKCCPYYELRLE